MDAESNKRNRRWVACLSVVLALLVIAYPLSTGPVLALLFWANAGQAAFDVLNTVYLPVQYAADFIGMTDAFHSYVNWWLAMIEV
jgi:hypothetical protein